MSYKFFENKDCEYYPCHDGERLNCLFCFCPIYFIEDCGGRYGCVNINGKQVKDCSACGIPHSKNGYEYIIEKIKQHE